MRYVLIYFGGFAMVAGVITGINALIEQAPRVLAVSGAAVLAGVIMASIGLATIDIVNAIDRLQKPHAPERGLTE